MKSKILTVLRLASRVLRHPTSLRSGFVRLLQDYEKAQRDAGLNAIFQKYRDFTMVPQSNYLNNLGLASSFKQVPGCIVECGVWRGGMIAGIADLMGPDRDYVLFDSFQGLPSAKDIDGRAALAWQGDVTSPHYYDNCAAPREFAERAMSMSGCTRVEFHAGWFDKTLPGYCPPGPIAILRLDGDWYDSTMTCLTALFPHVTPGGIVIIDDYYMWDGCARAIHDYLSRCKSNARVCQWHHDVAYIRLCES